MPVMRKTDQQPGWVKWSNFGLGTVTDAAQLERHFHDADEYWVVFEGRARVMSEGEEYEIGPGDVLCTKMGDEHDILEVIEGPLRTFWFEDELRGRKRPGHLHRGEDD
jgi:mannose-6-phosphate isomerase-like protein (cupin superfamily)